MPACAPHGRPGTGRPRRGSAALLLFTLVAAGPALAATATATFAVTATVVATCTTSAGPLAFGTYTGVQANATTTVTVTCTNTTPYNIGLNAGLGVTPTATFTTRKMTGPSATLNYSLGKDAAQAANWGNTVAVDTVAGTATGSPIAVTIYGRIPAGQFVAPNAYTDTITATVTY